MLTVKSRKNKRTKTGKVIRNKTEKTGVVLVERIIKHPLYKRSMKISKKYLFHDEANQTKEGDFIRIVECKPVSKCKRWRLLEIIRTSQNF